MFDSIFDFCHRYEEQFLSNFYRMSTKTYHIRCIKNRKAPGTTRSSEPTLHLRLKTTIPGILAIPTIVVRQSSRPQKVQRNVIAEQTAMFPSHIVKFRKTSITIKVHAAQVAVTRSTFGKTHSSAKEDDIACS